MPRKQKSLDAGYDAPLATCLRKLLSNNNYTQKQLSKDLGITPQSVGAYCDGSAVPSLNNLLKIADTFNVSLDYLTGYKPKYTTDDSPEAFYENLCKTYFDGNLTWMNDSRFSKSERTMLKMHLSDLLFRYKQLIEFTAEWSGHATDLFSQLNFSKSASQRVTDLIDWINAFPLWYEKACTDVDMGNSDNKLN